jgi:hypothetical protein
VGDFDLVIGEMASIHKETCFTDNCGVELILIYGGIEISDVK